MVWVNGVGYRKGMGYKEGVRVAGTGLAMGLGWVKV